MAIGRDHYVIAFTMEPARMYRWSAARSAFAPIRTIRGYLPVIQDDARMEKEQVRERVRGTKVAELPV